MESNGSSPAVINVQPIPGGTSCPVYESNYQDPSLQHPTANPFSPSIMIPAEQIYQEISSYSYIPGDSMMKPLPSTPPPEYSELHPTPPIPQPFNPQMPGYNNLDLTSQPGRVEIQPLQQAAGYSELYDMNVPQPVNMPLPGYNRLDPSLMPQQQNPNGLYDNSHYAVPNITATNNLYMGLQPDNQHPDSSA